MSRPEQRILLTSDAGVSALVSTHGATLVSLVAPDRDGYFADVVLGYDTRDEYVANADMYFGATIGRVAQRIGGAAFDLDGARYTLARNNGANSLHGGAERSFDKVVWEADARATAAGQEVELRYASPDGEEGYPGRVDATVIYRLTPGGELLVDYQATADRRTPVSLTNHAYWNLAGAGAASILDHELTVSADRYTPTDGELIPTGEITSVDGTPLDFRHGAPLAERVEQLEKTTGGIDHNLVLAVDRALDDPAARLHHPDSGRVLEIRTQRPCLQVYSGNLMRPVRGKLGREYPRRSGICLEPQAYPDALRHSSFDSIVLDAGDVYRETTSYRFLTTRGGL
jgi:aldose 1-epimerase